MDDESAAGAVGARSDAAAVEQFVDDLLGPLRASWDTSPSLLAVTCGPEHRLAYQNATSVRLLGRRELGLPLGTAFPELGGRPLTALDEVLATGEPVVMPRRDVGLRDLDGMDLVLHYVMAPVGTSPPFDGVVMTAVNVSGEVLAELAAERARLLTHLAEGMNAAGDPDAALQALTDALVPVLADVAAVFVTAATGRPEQAGTPSAITLSADLLAAAGPPPPPTPRDGPSPWQDALAAGKTVFIDLAADADGPTVEAGSGRWLASAHARNIAVVPLVVAGELAGALVLVAAGERAPYSEQDTSFLEDVAARAGAAVSHVRNYQHQRQTALTLQRALLPSAPPDLPSMQVAARYVAGVTDVEVGGDWWDVHRLGGDRVGIGVGDVSGRGVPAAILMGQARAGMRAAAHANLSPVELLTVLDGQVSDLVALDQGGDHRLPAKFATAAYAIIEPDAGTLRVASAGHPPLLVRYPSGRVERVQAPPGPPLGLGVADYAELVVPFPAGSLLAAFTDGLVESRTVDLDTGIAAVVDILASTPSDTPIDELADALLALADGTDDTALILLRYEDVGADVGAAG